MNKPYWVTFRDHKTLGICVNSNSPENASEMASTYKKVFVDQVRSLPYPATPSIGQSSMPPFCLHGDRCAGRTSCPRSLACSE